MTRGSKPRALTYSPEQQRALRFVADMTRALADAERLLDKAILWAWRENCALSDIGEAAGYVGDRRSSAAVRAMRARDRALARAQVRDGAEVH